MFRTSENIFLLNVFMYIQRGKIKYLVILNFKPFRNMRISSSFSTWSGTGHSSITLNEGGLGGKIVWIMTVLVAEYNWQRKLFLYKFFFLNVLTKIYSNLELYWILCVLMMLWKFVRNTLGTWKCLEYIFKISNKIKYVFLFFSFQQQFHWKSHWFFK